MRSRLLPVGLDVAESPAMARRAGRAADISREADVRRELFVAAYVATGFKPRDAAIAAGFSARTALSKGKELAVQLRAEIDALVASKKTSLLLQGDEVLRDLAASFRVDRRQFFNADRTLKSPADLTEEQARLVDGFDVSVTTYGEGEGARTVETSKLRLEKHGATREQAMRHLGLFPRDDVSKDPDEQARLVRERLGDIRGLSRKREKE